MENIRLIKLKTTDVLNRRFNYTVEIDGKIRELWFPWSIVSHTFPQQYPEGSEITVSYYGDRWRHTVDWIGSIRR